MDNKVVIAAFVVTASGVVNAVVAKKAITPVLIGSYIFVLVLALAQMFGGEVARFTDALAMLTVLYVLLAEFPWTTIIAFVQGKKI